MKLSYFQKLCAHKQHRRNLEKGIWVGERRVDNAQLLLFQIDQFYIEVAFQDHSDEVVRISSFDGGEELNPYLLDIDLSELGYQCHFLPPNDNSAK